MKKVRYVHADRDEHIVVTRDRATAGSGCAGLVLIYLFFSAGSVIGDLISTILVILAAVAAFALGVWRFRVDLRFRAIDRILFSLAISLLAGGITTFLLHDKFVGWATQTTYESEGFWFWKETWRRQTVDPFLSGLYHFLGFSAVFANGYAIVSVAYHFVTESQRLTRRG